MKNLFTSKMKNIIPLAAVLLVATATCCQAKTPVRKIAQQQQQQTVPDSMVVYVGQYQKTIHGDIFYIAIEEVKGEIFGTTLWDGTKMKLKHLSGDKFIVDGVDWAVQFIRDKDKKVIQMLVRGEDVWDKIKK